MKYPPIEDVIQLVVQLVITGTLVVVTWLAYLDWQESCVTLRETKAWVEELTTEQLEKGIGPGSRPPREPNQANRPEET